MFSKKYLYLVEKNFYFGGNKKLCRKKKLPFRKKKLPFRKNKLTFRKKKCLFRKKNAYLGRKNASSVAF